MQNPTQGNEMSNSNEIDGNSGINIVEDCLILTLPSDINTDQFIPLKKSILNKVSQNHLIGVIFDFNSISIMDSYEFNEFLNLTKMVKLFGVPAIIVGLQPGVVSALVDMDVDTDELLTFLNLDRGLNYLREKNMKINIEEDESNNEPSEDEEVSDNAE